jgi:hypothetical protein
VDVAGPVVLFAVAWYINNNWRWTVVMQTPEDSDYQGGYF